MVSPEFLTQNINTDIEQTVNQTVRPEEVIQPPEQRFASHFQGETGSANFAEVMNSAVSYAQISYNGLRARFAEWRYGKHREEVPIKEHEASFFNGLGDIAVRAVSERELENLPPVPTTTHVLASAAESHRKMRYLRAGLPVPPKPGTPAPLENFEIAMRPTTKQERKAAEQLAERVNDIRDNRKDQVTARKKFGGAGLHSGRQTRTARRDMTKRDQALHESGQIDAFELAQRKRARKALSVTRTPPVMSKRASQLEHFGEVMGTDYDQKAERARTDRDKAERKANEAREKVRVRRLKQDVARARLNARRPRVFNQEI